MGDEGKIEGEERHVINTNLTRIQHKEKAEEWDGRAGRSLVIICHSVKYLIVTFSTRQTTLREGRGGRFAAEKTCFPKLKTPPRYSK